MVSQLRDHEVRYILKRILDIVIAGILLILTLPIMIITAIFIKTTSKGPIVFRQQRVGRNKKLFTCYKFRSMYTGSRPDIHKEYIKKLIKGEIEPRDPKQAVYKLINDPRITQVGRFIRKTSIDELPQLFNVLEGNMSMVGPRPVIPYELEYYVPEMFKRFSIKPGITGLWQVSKRSAATYREMVTMDIFYITHWSIWLDLKILLRTIAVVFNTKITY